MVNPRFFLTDVFTDRKYGGNQLATLVDCDAMDSTEMQRIAREINFSETTFITSLQPQRGGYDVRIFTPRAEVEFAGHPTLGTAFVIRELLRLSREPMITLNLRIGQIPVTFTTGDGPPQLSMQQVTPVFGLRREAAALASVLGLDAGDIDGQLPVEEVSTGFPTLVVPLRSLDALKRIKINRDAYFSLVDAAWAKIILVFARQGQEAGQDIAVRVFADYYGIAEDAATGSSNGALAAYLFRHGLYGAPSVEVRVGQGYEMLRPSSLVLRTRVVDGQTQVFVGGSVVAVASGVWS